MVRTCIYTHSNTFADIQEDIPLWLSLVVHTAPGDEHNCKDNASFIYAVLTFHYTLLFDVSFKAGDSLRHTQCHHHEGCRNAEGQRVTLLLGVDPTLLGCRQRMDGLMGNNDCSGLGGGVKSASSFFSLNLLWGNPDYY